MSLKRKKYLIGYDPKLITSKTLNNFFNKSKFDLKPIRYNLIDEILKRKFKIKTKKFYTLPNKSIGEGYKSKINKCSNCGVISLGLSEKCMNCGADLEFNSKINQLSEKPSESIIEIKAEEIK